MAATDKPLSKHTVHRTVLRLAAELTYDQLMNGYALAVLRGAPQEVRETFLLAIDAQSLVQ